MYTSTGSTYPQYAEIAGGSFTQYPVFGAMGDLSGTPGGQYPYVMDMAAHTFLRYNFMPQQAVLELPQQQSANFWYPQLSAGAMGASFMSQYQYPIMGFGGWHMM